MQAITSNVDACKTRKILQPEQAIEIVQLKLSKSRPEKMKKDFERLKPGVVAKQYGISEKAVRDIWKGRTWLRETMHLDPALAALATRLRPPGRPRIKTDPIRGLDAQQYDTDRTDELVRSSNKRTQGHSTTADFEDLDSSKHSSRNKEKTNLPPPAQATEARFPYSWTASENWTESAFTLPPSSCANDPFHDDWGHWPQ